MIFWKIFYNVLAVPILWLSFHLLAIVNKKASRALKGRKQLFGTLRQKIDQLASGHRIWFHSSSMGEFEQAKPIIAELKKRHPDFQIIVSFFSSSGYDHSQSYKLANVITYIPFDSRCNAVKFVDIVKPALAVIVRYDIWPNHVWALKKAGIPVIIASATLRKQNPRHLPFLKNFHRYLYDGLDYILTVSSDDKSSFDSFGLKAPVVDVIGDTRYDQVWQRSALSKGRKIIAEQILKNKKVFVVGSSWKDDEDVILPACYQMFGKFPEFLTVLVPHEPTVENLERIEDEIGGRYPSIRFSNLAQYRNEKIIIIDSVGILMALYQYAHIAFVGGGFRSGVHNVLEPAAYGIPVLFGPEHNRSQEAATLLNNGSAFVVGDSNELVQLLTMFLNNEDKRLGCGKKALSLVENNIGATRRILFYVDKIL